jgi:DNA polymerase-3 subunit beta
LSIVGRAVASRSTLPVLNNVLIAADGARLKLSATNLEVAITCWIGAQIENEIAITVPAKTFSETIATMPKGGLEMTLADGAHPLTVRGDHAVSTVNGIDAAEFPILPMQEGGLSLSVEAFKNALGDVIYAVATDEARPVLTGVLLKIEKDILTLVATDGFRLAKSALQLSAPQKEAVSVIVPASALAKLRQIMAGDQLTLSFQNNQALFRFNTEDMEAQLAANLLEGNYPEYAALFPPGHTTKVTAPAEAILMACKVAHIFARENNGSMATLDVSDGGVKVSATSAETGSNESNVVATVEGEALKINLNMRYGIDAFSAAAQRDAVDVTIEFNGPTKPVVIRPARNNDGMATLIMPLLAGR